ncbi:hypothetical protein NE865_06410 [Phthorimaea operculella]|nr:hypothetical protein NE865_06410 [Phthorimaea operculella]
MSANNSTVIKFTKLPEYDFDSKVQWPRRTSYVLQPHLRRIITLDEEDELLNASTRSLKSQVASPQKPMSSTYPKRKIITITEEDDNRSVALSSKRTISGRTQAPSGSDVKIPTRSTSRNNVPSRYISKIDTKLSAKSIALSSSKVNNDTKNIKKPRTILKTRAQENNILPQDNNKVLATEKEKTQSNKKSYFPKNTPNNLGKNNVQPSSGIRKSDLSASGRKAPLKRNESLKICDSNDVIRVPIESDVQRSHTTPKKRPQATLIHRDIITEDKNVETEQAPVTVDVVAETDRVHIEKHSVCVQTVNILKANFDSLDIPNVTLIKDKDESKEDIVKMCKDLLPDLKVSSLGIHPVEEEIHRLTADEIKECSEPLPNLNMPDIEITPYKKSQDKPQEVSVKQRSRPIPELETPPLRMKTHKENKHLNNLGMSKSQSYIIGRGSVTYTTKQKIDFHLVSNKQETASSALSSPLAYPLNVVSIYKEEVNKSHENNESAPEDAQQKKTQTEENSVNASQLVNCSYAADCNKLMKPSEIISTIRLNDGLLGNDYISEQFQRELNFIDSFFESLQYLENCSLSNKSISDTSVGNWVSKSGFDVNVLSPEYNSLFSKFENGTNNEDTETMASKSLCLLNLLIRDEQRRAKNLLFVLKMREDALKDFAKSQIIWLENRKKHDNIDISTLRKKQRGALLKLQHEYGEMQRMRKALLALSEKRKVALMKTKKNIELKLKNNVSVDPTFLNKKKLKRSSASDRTTTPLKCFDLSSSGCDDSSTSRAKLEAVAAGACLLDVNQVDEQAAPEMFVTVDGGYLNILFNHFALPEMFSQGKSYEVNEEAIKSIVKSANSHNVANKSDIIERFISQIKQRDQDRSTTPSTARSLVEEFDHYYKGLTEEDQSFESSERHQTRDTSIECLVDRVETATEVRVEDIEVLTDIAVPTSELKVPEVSHAETNASTTAIAVSTNVPVFTPLPQSSSIEGSNSSMPAYIDPPVVSTVSPVHNEAEELRRQQLAIEREIKALEQQQCQLLVVREIPDKPPPPYIPPAGAPAPKPAQRFTADDTIEEKVERNLLEPGHSVSEPFDLFVADYCEESAARHRALDSDKPWDACNLLPQKPPLSQRGLVQQTARDLKDVLTPGNHTPPIAISVTYSDKPWDACNLLPQKPPLSQRGLVQQTARDLRTSSHPATTLHPLPVSVTYSDKPWDACNLLPQKPPLSQRGLVQQTARDLKDVLTPGNHTPPIASKCYIQRQAVGRVQSAAAEAAAQPARAGAADRARPQDVLTPGNHTPPIAISVTYSDKPWDACNLLPQKPPLSQRGLVQQTARDLKDVLTPGNHTPPIASVGTRRSDHIDDILMSEWRRCEPQWTALHADEANVKNQLFESIMHTLLDKTIHAYKRIIQRDCHVNEHSE